MKYKFVRIYLNITQIKQRHGRIFLKDICFGWLFKKHILPVLSDEVKLTWGASDNNWKCEWVWIRMTKTNEHLV